MLQLSLFCDGMKGTHTIYTIPYYTILEWCHLATMSSNVFGGEKVRPLSWGLWGCFGASGSADLKKVNRIMKREDFLQILQENLKLSARRLSLGCSWRFQEGDDPKNMSEVVKEWLNQARTETRHGTSPAIWFETSYIFWLLSLYCISWGAGTWRLSVECRTAAVVVDVFFFLLNWASDVCFDLINCCQVKARWCSFRLYCMEKKVFTDVFSLCFLVCIYWDVQSKAYLWCCIKTLCDPSMVLLNEWMNSFDIHLFPHFVFVLWLSRL